MKYPKVLIISERFIAGDAVSGLNIFSDWERSKLFCASRNIMYHDKFSRFYRLGRNEVQFKFPLNKFNHVVESGEVTVTMSSSLRKPRPLIIKFLYLRIIVPLLWFFNSFSGRLRYVVSDEFLKWVDSVSPDYIYTSVGSLEMGEFIYSLISIRPNLKLIFHGYDDWVEPSHRMLKNTYSPKAKELLKMIISKASLCWVVSEKMVSDYTLRYNRHFECLSNPYSGLKDSIQVQKTLGLTFIGKISYHNENSIMKMAKALNVVAKKTGHSITFDIFSELNDYQKNKILSLYRNSIFHGWVSHEKILNVLASSRFLYLPISSDNKTIRFTKYSMSTKMSEYLSSGTLMIYSGPDGIAMTDLVNKYKCAYRIKGRTASQIAEELLYVITHYDENNEYITNAQNLFNESFEISSTRKRVREYIINDYCQTFI